MAERVAEVRAIKIIRREELAAAGLSTHQITEQVRAGRVIRARRGLYLLPDAPPDVVAAVRIGGRLACLTLLRMLGVFVKDARGLHVHVRPHLSRSRARRPADAILHWSDCQEEGLDHVVSVWDAVRQSVRCQTPRCAIATLDSVLHHRLLTREHLVEMFKELPTRFQPLLELVDGSAESGPESFMRLILRSLGLHFETQVSVPEVGRVDFVVEGWLIIECDSREFHEGWEKQVRDRARDLAAAGQGYVTIRFLASDIFEHRDEVRAAVQRVVASFSPLLVGRSAPQLRRTAPAIAAQVKAARRLG